MTALVDDIIRAIRGSKKHAKNEEEITVMACTKCGKTLEREFAGGDFVFGPASPASAAQDAPAGDACSVCGGAMFIKQIFIRTEDSD